MELCAKKAVQSVRVGPLFAVLSKGKIMSPLTAVANHITAACGGALLGVERTFRFSHNI